MVEKEVVGGEVVERTLKYTSLPTEPQFNPKDCRESPPQWCSTGSAA